LNVLSRKFSVTNSLLDNPFEHPSKLSPVFETRRLNFWLNRLGDKSMRQALMVGAVGIEPTTSPV
jgi:hypothetical protein